MQKQTQKKVTNTYCLKRDFKYADNLSLPMQRTGVLDPDTIIHVSINQIKSAASAPWHNA